MAVALSSYGKMFITFNMPKLFSVFTKASGEGNPQEISRRLPKIVTSVQIDATLNNPLNKIIKADLALGAAAIESQNAISNLLSEVMQYDDTIAQVASQLKAKTTKESPEAVNKAQDKLKKSSAKVTDVHNQARQLEEQVATKRQQTDQLITEQQQEWQAFTGRYSQALITHLEEAGIPLTGLEKEAILRDESILETIRQFEDRNLPLPKRAENSKERINKDNLASAPSHFFRLRASYAIHASLSRRLETPTAESVDSQMQTKALTSFFAEIDKEAKALTARQAKEVDSIKKDLQSLDQQVDKVHFQLAQLGHEVKDIQDSFKLQLPQQQAVTPSLSGDRQPTATASNTAPSR